MCVCKQDAGPDRSPRPSRRSSTIIVPNAPGRRRAASGGGTPRSGKRPARPAAARREGLPGPASSSSSSGSASLCIDGYVCIHVWVMRLGSGECFARRSVVTESIAWSAGLRFHLKRVRDSIRPVAGSGHRGWEGKCALTTDANSGSDTRDGLRRLPSPFDDTALRALFRSNGPCMLILGVCGSIGLGHRARIDLDFGPAYCVFDCLCRWVDFSPRALLSSVGSSSRHHRLRSRRGSAVARPLRPSLGLVPGTQRTYDPQEVAAKARETRLRRQKLTEKIFF